MDDLKRYVNRLFVGYKETAEVRELKAEVLSNLEARVADYTGEGMPRGEAVARAKSNLGTIDLLISHQKPVRINRYKVELLQAALLYTLIAWVLTVPLRLIPSGAVVNTVLMFVAVGLGVSFLILSSRKSETYLKAVAPVDQKKMAQCRKIAWLVWTLFIAAVAVFTSGKYFGSDIWFGRPLHLDGPYRFAQVVVSYALPFITVVLPLLFNKADRLAEKYEVKD